MFVQWYWFVYIIECRNGSYYTGCTGGMNERWWHHLSGHGSRYTHKHGVKRLAHYEMYDSLEAARTRERQIKGWTRAKKKRLISGEWKQPPYQ